jgi:hypothetical protein
MTQELKNKWLEALRSGEYKQGIAALQMVALHSIESNFYCCLGVLCDISGLGTWELNRTATAYNFIAKNSSEESNFFLPATLTTELNLPIEQQDELVEMNDSGKSFDEIANWIEKNV